MAFSTRTLRIIAASALSLILVTGAYVFSGPVPFLKNKTADAEGTDALLKAYAAKDTDSDGLPDWEEALYGTDPNNAHSVNATLTDSEAANKGMLTPKTSATIPQDQTTSTKVNVNDLPGKTPAAGSVTEQFSHDFFQKYIDASGGGQQLTADQQQALVTELLSDYTSRAGKLLLSQYTSISIHVSPSVTVTQYAGAVEQIIRAHDVPAGSGEPITLMNAFIQENDKSALPKLGVLANSYAGITKDLLQVSVPPALAAQHLVLVQSFDTLARSTKAVSNYDNDPLAVLGSLSLYQPTSQKIIDTMKVLAEAIITSGGEPATGTPGAMIVSVARASQQQP